MISPIPPLAVGQSVMIIDGAFKGCTGTIMKCPTGNDNIDVEEKWHAACDGDQYDGPERRPLPDLFHVKTDPSPYSDIQILKTGVIVTFLQYNDVIQL